MAPDGYIPKYSVPSRSNLTFLISDIRTLWRSERQSVRISEIKNVGLTWMDNCNQLTFLPFKGLINAKNFTQKILNLDFEYADGFTSSQAY